MKFLISSKMNVLWDAMRPEFPFISGAGVTGDRGRDLTADRLASKSDGGDRTAGFSLCLSPSNPLKSPNN